MSYSSILVSTGEHAPSFMDHKLMKMTRNRELISDFWETEAPDLYPGAVVMSQEQRPRILIPTFHSSSHPIVRKDNSNTVCSPKTAKLWGQQAKRLFVAGLCRVLNIIQHSKS